MKISNFMDIFYIKKSNFGNGLFAKREINKFEKILIFEGPIVTKEKAILLDVKKYGSDIENALQIEKEKYIYPEDPARIVNHSCNPNSGLIQNLTLIAIKKIKKDEEINYDYSTTMDEDSWNLKCGCGEKNCRKLIEDFKYLPKKIQIKYLNLGVVQSFIFEKFLRI